MSQWRFIDVVVATLMALMFLVSWAIALGRLIAVPFWDARAGIAETESANSRDDLDEALYNATTFRSINRSYYTSRFVYFTPHVAAAVVWWNTYFVQLVPRVRRALPRLHVWNGRVLMCAALVQVATGTALGLTSHSPTILLVSLVYAIMVLYIVYHAWCTAWARDIRRHRFWAIKLAGYMQTIAAQRFFMVLLIIHHHSTTGGGGLYAALDSSASLAERNAFAEQLFDDSFVLAIIVAPAVTEWYQAADAGYADSGGGSSSTKKRS
mmetsp:Transcript_5446/g.13248  ORF Transcript_5446/g.13248 Transcript_5446/m.13248 type:complete len:267 (+) Transcript_5446:34-834(+)|eukprot:CAMPEP_0198308898 /NCGR_PEP_ID=MMETSP1450-20131203/1406_1 /TAXON_ID=753684 ORGANISM="Madagascaria erythrocladiodes, Strain CCMP3234" /NCGR_SAMPLE_ID=MMETSP1450 /ASSEMBLY_ACC=CAM_ASM_001115 /LENGTH=266 /DNA_ID=CAMNT_0044011615 /DNA_START=64 /DNA_END=864 /DNA_ORIENTATION=+